MKPKTILVVTLSAVGHVNACTGALAPLLCRGHRIVFLVEEAFRGKVSQLGFEEHVMCFPKSPDELNPGENAAKVLIQLKVMGNFSTYEKLKNLIEKRLHGEKFMSQFAIQNGAIEEAIKAYKPDLIYYDAVFPFPAIHYSGIPWVNNMSTQPLYYIYSDEIPPGCSGLPFGGNQEEARKYNKLRHGLFYSKKYNDLYEKLGYLRYPNDRLYPGSQILNVYAYPDEIDYSYVQSLGWFNLQVFNKNLEVANLDQLVPENFLNDTLNGNFSGKLIYLSLGSMGSIDLTLMNRLVGVLGKTNHKYIVSKGPRHQEFELAEQNMWGDRFLPQMKIIPHVDLVITHGGNNTTTETFAQGKPMIVMPLFGDQFDNAQRIHETGFGARFNPYEFEETKLFNAIDLLLNNENLKIKLMKAAKRIQATNRHEELADKIEELLGKSL